jgi:hypothetical protein
MKRNALRRRAVILVAVVNVLLTVGLLEVGLRVQQRLGPVYDLAVRRDVVSVELSDPLNHVPAPGPDVETDGTRKLDKPNAAACAPRLLFMGDSFMQGQGPADNIPYYVRRFFRQSLHRELCVFNADQRMSEDE